MKIPLTIVAAFLLQSASAQTDLYVMAGQSNMVGVQCGQTPVNNPTMIWSYNDQGEWVQAKDPLYAASNGTGPGVAFADALAGLTGHQIGIIPCAVGGTSAAQWTPTYAVHTLYGDMLLRVNNAVKASGGTVRGFVWYQGEGDVFTQEDVFLYAQRTSAIFRAIRVDLGNLNLPIVFVQLGPWPGPQVAGYWRSIQYWQDAIAQTNMPNVSMVSAESLTAIPSNPRHLCFSSQICLGGMLAQAMYQILNGGQ